MLGVSLPVQDAIPFINPKKLSIKHTYGILLPKSFISLLNSNTVLTGSYALASYLVQEGIAHTADAATAIDIYVSTRRENGIDAYIELIVEMLSTYTYNIVDHSSCEDKIKKVIIFSSRCKKTTVRIIVVDTPDVINYIKTNADVSVRATWWNHTTNHFETLDPYHTKRGEMYMINEKVDDTVLRGYIHRGFKNIKVPCPVYLDRDLREGLDSEKFRGIVVYNIFTLEETPINEFLRDDECNIVLKAGDQYYGFVRNDLIQHMNTKKIYVERIDVDAYETPFNHCITAEAFTHLKYADYAIYELFSSHTETIDDVVKSLYNCKCYSVKQWINEVTAVTDVTDVTDDTVQADINRMANNNTVKTLSFTPLIYAPSIYAPLSIEFTLETEAHVWRFNQTAIAIGIIGTMIGTAIRHITGRSLLYMFVYMFICIWLWIVASAIVAMMNNFGSAVWGRLDWRQVWVLGWNGFAGGLLLGFASYTGMYILYIVLNWIYG